MKSIYKKGVCIYYNHKKLVFNKIYKIRHQSDDRYFLDVYDKNKFIEIYPYYMFKKVEVFRKERLKNILNGI